MILNSLRYTIYFFFFLFGAIFFLWFINFSSNRIIHDQQSTHAKIVKLNNRFYQYILDEEKVQLDSETFAGLISKEKDFFHECAFCHDSKTELPQQRIELLGKKHEVLLVISQLRNGTQQRLKTLADSVHYIHEHHIVTLKNYLQYIRAERQAQQRDKLWQVYAEEVSGEPEIVRQAVDIQHQITNIVYDFDMLTGGIEPKKVQALFTDHIHSFYQAVNVFEEYSLDAQDGLLVEELLANGRSLDRNFNQLIALETWFRELTARLDRNREELEQAFVQLEAVLHQRQTTLMKRTVVISWGSLLLAVFLALLFLLRARTIIRAIDGLVGETHKISADISYQIPEQTASLAELTVLRTALNKMAAGFSNQVQALNDEIQNRRRIESLLSREKKEWERTFDAVPDMIFILGEEGTVLRANKAMRDLAQMSEKEMIGLKCFEIVDQLEDFPSCCTYLSENGADKTSNVSPFRQYEFYSKKFDLFFSVIVSALYGADGVLNGYVHLMRDISERKRVEQEKVNYALYLDSILSSSHTAIAAIDPQLRVKYFNPEAERIFQISAQEVLGSDIYIIHEKMFSASVGDKEKVPSLQAEIDRVLKFVQQQKSHAFNFKLGPVVVDARLSVIRNSAGELSGYLLMASDVTDRVLAEEQHHLMVQRLQKAEKMEAIGLMAGGVAHDLNNILSGIINYPELMLLQMGDDDRWRDSLEAIRDSGIRAAAIVADLLTIARGAASEKQIISINEMIARYLQSPEFKKLTSRFPAIAVETDLAPDLESCFCSSVHLQKMLMNLVGNSFEAIRSKDKGRVILSTSNEYIEENQDGTNNLTPGRYVKIRIQDTGKGITEEDAVHIFEPFYSKKKMGHSGTGLGLTVVWNTVQDHKGTISVSSDAQGTTFTILLPASEVAAEPQKTAENTLLISGQGSILVVDDEPLQRDVAQQMLATLGYDVVTAANGREAVQYIHDYPVDLVILDMIMEPDMNGRQTLEEILKIRPDQKALIVSGYAESSEVKKACTLGKTSLMHKPYTLKKLGAAVQKAMAASVE